MRSCWSDTPTCSNTSRGALREDEAVEDLPHGSGSGPWSAFLPTTGARRGLYLVSVLCRSTALDCLREHRRKGDLAAGTLGEELADPRPGPEEELLPP